MTREQIHLQAFMDIQKEWAHGECDDWKYANKCFEQIEFDGTTGNVFNRRHVAPLGISTAPESIRPSTGRSG